MLILPQMDHRCRILCYNSVMDHVKQRRDLIKEAAITAGTFIKTAAPTEGMTLKEGRGNFVTAADLASEKIVIDAIKKYFPKDKILSEETDSVIKDILAVDHLWIIDPIDGTNNFAHQRNYSCVSIGYAENGVSKLGAVYNPFTEEFYFAEAGKGAFLNDTALQIGTETDISKAYVCTDNSYDPARTKLHIELLLAIEPTPFVLIKGSAAITMCEVAAGKMDLYFHTCIHPWDNAAGLLVIQEAGGIAKNFKNQRITFDSPDIIVGNEVLVNNFIEIVKKHPEINPQ